MEAAGWARNGAAACAAAPAMGWAGLVRGAGVAELAGVADVAGIADVAGGPPRTGLSQWLTAGRGPSKADLGCAGLGLRPKASRCGVLLELAHAVLLGHLPAALPLLHVQPVLHPLPGGAWRPGGEHGGGGWGPKRVGSGLGWGGWG